MTTLGWIVLGVIAIPVAWFGILGVLSFAVPKSRSGALLLRKELRENRVSTDNLPSEFYAECVKWADSVSRFSAQTPVARQAEFVRSIENLAQTAALWCREPDCPMFKIRGDEKNFYRETFEKYNVRAA